MKNYTDNLRNNKFNISVYNLRKGDVVVVSIGKEFQFGPMIIKPKQVWNFVVQEVYGDSISFYTDKDYNFKIMLQKDHEFFSWLEQFIFIKRLNFWKRLFL